jgi:hypothetical protein
VVVLDRAGAELAFKVVVVPILDPRLPHDTLALVHAVFAGLLQSAGRDTRASTSCTAVAAKIPTNEKFDEVMICSA